MLYILEQGPVEQKIIEQCQRARVPFPAKIRDAPILTLGLDFFFRAWIELNSCRHIGMDEGCISWESIRNYCNEYDIVGELRQDMFYLVRSMDNTYLEYKRNKAKKQQISNNKGNKKPRGK